MGQDTEDFVCSRLPKCLQCVQDERHLDKAGNAVHWQPPASLTQVPEEDWDSSDFRPLKYQPAFARGLRGQEVCAGWGGFVV